MKWRKWILLAMAAVLVGGCIPKRYEWSPDGLWMTVLGEDGLRLADARGNLQSMLIPDVKVATWFPDSQRLLVAGQIHPATWKELVKYLSPAEADLVAGAGERARGLAMVYDWSAPGANKWDSFEAKFVDGEKQGKYDTAEEGNLPGAIGTYMRDNGGEALQKTMPPERWKELEDVRQDVNTVQAYTVGAGGAQPGPRLMASVDQSVTELRVSPTGQAAIVVSQANGAHAAELRVYSTDESHPPVLVSDRASAYPDWSPDGREVVFAHASDPPQQEDTWLGSVTRTKVIGDDGKLLDKVDGGADLCGLLCNQLTRVRCLKDGRVIFSSADVTLPAAAGDIPDRQELFVISPGPQSRVERLLSRQSVEKIGDLAEFFEISPDGRYASIPDQRGRVMVADLTSGNVTTSQDGEFPRNNNNNWTLPTVPAWRSNDELTFAAPSKNGPPEVMLWSMTANKGKPLSATWPAKMLDELAPKQ